ncbi:MAG: anaerobic carbon-monoxide dehydrogenase catalytic subunit [Candidatus Omnitrophota bacterium]
MAEKKNLRSIDPAVQYLLEKAQTSNIETGWDRFDAMQDPCGFSELGLCCRICMLGPCRIDPFGEGPQKGSCGISADGMVARNLCRMIVAGASAHCDHGAHILEAFERVALGHEVNFKFTDDAKLRALARQLEVSPEGSDSMALARELIPKIQRAFSNLRGINDWLTHVIPRPRLERLLQLRVLPPGIDACIRETLHRTNMGVDADPVNLLLGGIKCSISDFLGMDISAILSDILLGTPHPIYSRANLGVLEKDAVNIAIHGHNPLISEAILSMVPQFQEKARAAGAPKGINIVGVCCSGNEALMRRGIPQATNLASQELVILTGAVDAMVVDVQCIMPSLAQLCECFHTRLITTMGVAKIPGAQHCEINALNAEPSAQKILEESIEAFKKRDPQKVDIPDFTSETLVGFSTEAIVELLGRVNPQDPLQPLIDTIVSGDIYGVVLFAGCNNYRVTQDSAFIAIAEKLSRDNILLLATGCGAGAFAKRGFLSPQATDEICGDKLKKVLTDLGHAAGLNRPLPPIWHMGACVDNSRAVRLVFALAEKLGVDVDKLPVAASAPEPATEKAISIGTGAITLGITTHLGVVPPVLGGKTVTKILTETAKDLFGSHFLIETDPQVAAQKIKEVITEKRIGLGLKTERPL